MCLVAIHPEEGVLFFFAYSTHDIVRSSSEIVRSSFKIVRSSPDIVLLLFRSLESADTVQHLLLDCVGHTSI